MKQDPLPTASKTASAVRGVFWSSINVIVPTAAGFLIFIVVSRYVGPAEFGAVALATGIVAVASILLPLGYGEALIQRQELSEDHLSTVFAVGLVCSTLAYGLLFLSRHALAAFFQLELLSQLLPVVGLKLFLDALVIAPQALITRRLSFRLIAGRTAVATFMASVVSITLAVSGYGLWALVVSQLVASSTSLVATAWGARWWPSSRPSLAALASISNYGLFSSATKALQMLTTQADAAFVAHALGVGQAGIYSFARRLFQLMTDVISGSLGTVAHPLFSSIQDDVARVRRGFLLATFLSSACAFPIFVGLALIADDAVRLVFGPLWADAVWPIRIYCVLGLMTATGVIQAGLILSRGLASWWFYYQLVSATATLVLLIGAARFGVIVLLAAITLKTAFIWPFAVAKSARIIGMSVPHYLSQFIAPVLASGIMAAAVWFARPTMADIGPTASLFLEVVIGGAVYVIALGAMAGRRLRDIVSIVVLKK